MNCLHFADLRPLILFFAAPLLQLQPVAVGWGSWRRLGHSVSGAALGAPSTRLYLLGALFSDTVTRGR